MVVVSRNMGSAPLIGSNVIRDCASGGSVWSEKGPRDTSYARARPVQSKADQMPEWSEKAPLDEKPKEDHDTSTQHFYYM